MDRIWDIRFSITDMDTNMVQKEKLVFYCEGETEGETQHTPRLTSVIMHPHPTLKIIYSLARYGISYLYLYPIWTKSDISVYACIPPTVFFSN